MVIVEPNEFHNYTDENNNQIIVHKDLDARKTIVTFQGKNNSVIIGEKVEIHANLDFAGDDSHIKIGNNCRFRGKILVGDGGCSVDIGEDFDCAGRVYITAAEKTKVTIGNWCRFNADIQIRTHDMHPIFDITTNQRINHSKSIYIGNRVWFGGSVAVLKGVIIGDNSVIGLNSTVTRNIPSNCLAVGTPAEVIRKNIDWDLIGLTVRPFPEYSKAVDFKEPKEKSFSEKFLFKHPTLSILFKWREVGIKNTITNLRGFKAICKQNIFDENYYLQNFQDAPTPGLKPIVHYIYYGYKEGWNPNPVFDGDYYIKNNRDVIKANMNPLIHYCLYGKKEGRKVRQDE